MTDKKKRTYIQVVTPPGVFAFPSLAKPDSKYNNYKVKVRFSSEAYAEIMEQMQEHFDAAVEAGEAAFKELKPAARKKLGSLTINEIGSPVYDDNEEETGEYEINFSKKASGERKDGSKWTASPPAVFDANGVPFPKRKRGDIWSGTVGAVAFTYEPDGYFIAGTGACGLRMMLDGVQVIELQGPGGERSASAMGFGKVDGFSVDDIDDDFGDDDADTDGEDNEDAAGDF